MTFAELKTKLIDLNNARAVLLMLVEHIDADFRSIGGSEPKKAIKTDDGTLVPEASLEVISVKMTEEIRAIDQEIAVILNANLETQPPVVPTAQA